MSNGWVLLHSDQTQAMFTFEQPAQNSKFFLASFWKSKEINGTVFKMTTAENPVVYIHGL